MEVYLMSTKPDRGDYLGDSVLSIATGGQPPAESLSERLLRALRGHIQSEAAGLEECRGMSESTSDPVVKFVLNQYMAEEQRHHDLFVLLATQIAEELEPIGRVNTLPSAATKEKAPETAKRLKVLAQQEKRGINKLRQLARETKDEYAGVLSMMLETVAFDSAKHEFMLGFAQSRVE